MNFSIKRAGRSPRNLGTDFDQILLLDLQAFRIANKLINYELSLVGKETRSQQIKISMIISGVNIETGKSATLIKYKNKGEGCAEDQLVKMLGGDAPLIRFSLPYRPTYFLDTGLSFEVCSICQTKYDKSQFALGTRFTKKPKPE